MCSYCFIRNHIRFVQILFFFSLLFYFYGKKFVVFNFQMGPHGVKIRWTSISIPPNIGILEFSKCYDDFSFHFNFNHYQYFNLMLTFYLFTFLRLTIWSHHIHTLNSFAELERVRKRDTESERGNRISRSVYKNIFNEL